MARKRIALGSDVESRIAEGIRRGETAEHIAAAIGGSVSPSTVSRRMREQRGSVKARRHNAKPASKPAARAVTTATARPAPPASHEALPASPDDIPEGATLPELQSLLERCKAALALAEREQNLPLVGQMIRVAAQISETIRKATPPKQADPNDSPDILALRVEASRKWHEMIDLVADETA